MLWCLRVWHFVPARVAAVQRVKNGAENREKIVQGEKATIKEASTEGVRVTRKMWKRKKGKREDKDKIEAI